MEVSPTPYIGRGRWVRDITGWTMELDPPCFVPAMHMAKNEFPAPPELGGPEGWFPVQLDWTPILDAPVVEPSQRLKKLVLRWCEASKELMDEITESGLVVNRTGSTPPDVARRSKALSSIGIEMARALMVYTALAKGEDFGLLDELLLHTELPELRIALDHDDFRALVRGGEVSRTGARIILKDIGFVVMQHELELAMVAAHSGREAPC